MIERRGAAAPAEESSGPGAVSPVLALRAEDGATAEIHRHGAHVTSWCPADDADDRLYLSPRSKFGGSAAIRGGVPVIFPQFAAEGPLPRHGFARTSLWSIGCIAREADGMAEAELVLRDSPETHAIWNAAFKAVLAVSVVARQLAITLRVENVGEKPFSFTAALHTYLRVHDVADAEIHGLRGTLYRVSGDRELVADGEERLPVRDYVDRVYVGAPRRLELRERDRSMIVEMEGFPDAVIWNPGRERAAALDDLEPGDERRFVCVEAAAVQTPVTLGAGRQWAGSQTLTAR
ncbi:MAG: D-hexose-6-phosphate mutarotase [Gemmatimonadetes bacterium]|nr:MAG: D-hexose-6-phosphate mutarotase [Gemmatimonadota bacterium]